MANPQRENGFTGIANEILEELAKCKLNGTQTSILFAVFRFTYGFNRKQHELSLTFLENHTGIKKKSLSPEINKLIEQKVLMVFSDFSYDHKSREIGFNKNYDQWTIPKRTVPQIGNSPLIKEQSPNQGTVQKNTDIPTVHSPNSPSTREQSLNQGTVPQIGNQERKGSSSSSSLIDNGFANVSKFFRENLQVGITVSPFNMQLLGDIYDEFGEELLLAAMKVATKEQKKGIPYMEGILRKWKESGVTTLEDARKHEVEFKNRFKNKQVTKRSGGFQKPEAAIKYGELKVEDM